MVNGLLLAIKVNKMEHTFIHENKQIIVSVENEADCIKIIIDGQRFDVEKRFENTNELKLTINGKPCMFYIARNKDTTYVFFEGRQFIFQEQPEDENSFHASGVTAYVGDFVTSPMPGTIIKINCKEGDTVQENDTLVIVEAMKMENMLRSPVNGTVSKVHNTEGDLVDAGAPIVEFENEK